MMDAIMVGMHGNAGHRAAPEWATRSAARDGARLEPVFVVERPCGDGSDEPSRLLGRAAKSLLPAEQETALRIADRALVRAGALTGSWSSKESRPRVHVSTRFLYGHVGVTLASVSGGADLLVVGARSDQRRGFSGSLPLRVAAAAAAPEIDPAIDVRTDIVEVSQSRGLVAAAEGQRMLVVGTRNRRSAQRITLGSVSHDVLLNVREPVLVSRAHCEFA
ncbi:universal stress protein [Leifsonia sp. EB34]|uniref:universal stress protein n=1 Tax=Leifsonia sp. EB34 TaxID=3156303 RepID=UPI003514CF31